MAFDREFKRRKKGVKKACNLRKQRGEGKKKESQSTYWSSPRHNPGYRRVYRRY